MQQITVPETGDSAHDEGGATKNAVNSMKALILYVVFVTIGGLISAGIGYYVEKEFSSTASLIVFLALFFSNFAVSWLAVILAIACAPQHSKQCFSGSHPGSCRHYVAFDLLDMVLLLFAAPSQHQALVGQEHGRTIPLAAMLRDRHECGHYTRIASFFLRQAECQQCRGDGSAIGCRSRLG
jgi:hypothetical protein